MKGLKALVMAAVVAALGVSSVQADVVDIGVQRDSAYVTQSWPAGWFSKYSNLIRVAPNATSYFYSDTSGLTASEGYTLQVDSAVFRFCVRDFQDTAATTVRTFQAYAITENWSEGNPAGDDPELWDYITTPPSIGTGYGTVDISGDMRDAWVNVDVTALVQTWLDGTQTNYGIAIKDVSGNDWMMVNIYDRDVSMKGAYLTVYYSLVPIPEPTSIAALGLGAAGLMIRRRK